MRIVPARLRREAEMEDLRIGWLPGTDPRIGTTLVGGYRTKGGNRKLVGRDLDADLAQVTRNAARLVVLLTDTELSAAGLDDLVERGLRYGLAVVRRPVIAGRRVPDWLMNEIASWRHYGPTVYADTSGRGRAAVAAAWALTADEGPVSEVISRVQAACGPKALASEGARDRILEFWSVHRALEGKTDWWYLLPTTDLRRSHLPPPKAPWHTHLNNFALSFDGYTFAGGMEKLITLSDRHAQIFRDDGHLASNITFDAARACLFRIQRAVRYRGEGSPEDDPDYDPGPYLNELLFAWALVEYMRKRISRP
jgi:hypothetical protein